jgi:TolB-like protein
MMVADDKVLRIGAWRVDPALDEISRDGATVKLEPRATRVLLCLADHAGQVVSVDQLLDAVWKDVVVTPDSVYQAVAGLRRALGDTSKEPAYIANVLRRGYRLVAAVTPWNEAATASSHSRARTFEDTASTRLQPIEDRPSLAVLPLVNMSSNPEQEYFADGITDGLITELSRLPGLFVISRHSSFVYKGISKRAAEIGAELGIRYLLEGSVQRAAMRVRITVQLIDAASGAYLWAERYDRELKDIFAVQDDVT